MKVGVIGIGYWGKKHVDEYIQLGHDVTICDNDEKNILECKKIFEVVKVKAFEDLLNDDTIKNLPRGDLMVQMSVLDSDGYTRKGNDLYTTKTIDCFQAIRGIELQLKTLLDTVIKVQVPAGTQPETLILCKGQGMPVHKTLNIRGNLYVRINIIIPQLSQADLNKIKNL